MPPAVNPAVDPASWSFETLRWPEVIHVIRAENAPSRALAARLGSTFRGLGSLPAPHEGEYEIWGQSRP